MLMLAKLKTQVFTFTFKYKKTHAMESFTAKVLKTPLPVFSGKFCEFFGIDSS